MRILFCIPNIVSYHNDADDIQMYIWWFHSLQLLLQSSQRVGKLSTSLMEIPLLEFTLWCLQDIKVTQVTLFYRRAQSQYKEFLKVFLLQFDENQIRCLWGSTLRHTSIMGVTTCKILVSCCKHYKIIFPIFITAFFLLCPSLSQSTP